MRMENGGLVHEERVRVKMCFNAGPRKCRRMSTSDSLGVAFAGSGGCTSTRIHAEIADTTHRMRRRAPAHNALPHGIAGTTPGEAHGNIHGLSSPSLRGRGGTAEGED